MKTNTMMPWGTISDNKHIVLFDTCKLAHDWKLTEVKAKKVAVGNGTLHRFRQITRTCKKCGYLEETTIHKN